MTTRQIQYPARSGEVINTANNFACTGVAFPFLSWDFYFEVSLKPLTLVVDVFWFGRCAYLRRYC
jgi:hypothetical protein